MWHPLLEAARSAGLAAHRRVLSARPRRGTSLVLATSYRPVPVRAALGDQAPRSLKRWILPVAVLGSSAKNSIQRGYL